MFLRRMVTSMVAAVVLLSVPACTGDDDDQADEPAETTSSPTATGPQTRLDRPSAALSVRIPQVTGIDRSKRGILRKQIGASLAAWITPAYLEPGPLTGAFAAWTPQAAGMARGHSTVTTKLVLGKDVTRVIAERQTANVFVFGAGNRPGGASAWLVIRLLGERPDGTLARAEVRGRVYLTHDGPHWRIFGYDLFRAEAR